MGSVAASVVICTRDRSESLGRCLRFLDADRSVTSAEIVVVDNGSSDATQQVIAQAAQTSRRQTRLVVERVAGTSAARNAGIRVASGELVLFTDDDTVIHDGWIDALCEAFTPGVGAVGGRVLPVLDGARPDWLGDLATVPSILWDYGPDAFEMGGDKLPLGANMAVQRRALDGLDGPFDRRLGHTEGVSLGFDETHLVRQIAARGNRVVYAPAAVVDHVVVVERLSHQAMRRSFFQSGIGRARHRRLTGDPDKRPLPRRARDAAAAYRHATRLKRRGDVEEELLAYMQAGERIEALLARAPALSAWCARRLAR